MKKHNKIALILIIVLLMPIILSIYAFADTVEEDSLEYLRLGEVSYKAYKKGLISHTADYYSRMYMTGKFNGTAFLDEIFDAYCDVVYQYDISVEKTGRYSIEFDYESTRNTDKVLFQIITQDGVYQGERILYAEKYDTDFYSKNSIVELREGITYTVALLIRMDDDNASYYTVDNQYWARIKYGKMVYDEPPPEGEPDPIEEDDISCDLWLDKIDEQGRYWYRYVGDIGINLTLEYAYLEVVSDLFEIELYSNYGVEINIYLDKIKAPVAGNYYPNLYILDVECDNGIVMHGIKNSWNGSLVNNYYQVRTSNPEELIGDLVFKNEVPYYGNVGKGQIIEDRNNKDFRFYDTALPSMGNVYVKFIPYVIVDPLVPAVIGDVYETEEEITDGYSTGDIITYDTENNYYTVNVYDESNDTIYNYITTSIEYDKRNNNVYFTTVDGFGSIIYTDESIIIIYSTAEETNVYEYQLGKSMSGKVEEYKDEYDDDEYYYLDKVKPKDDDDDDDGFNLWKWIRDRIFNAIGALIDAIVNWIIDAVSFLVEIILDVMRTMFDFVLGIVRELLSGVNDVFSFFSNGIDDFITGNWGEKYE